MDPIDQREADLEPLSSDDLIERRVASLIGRAQGRQVWLLFLHGDDVQSPLIMPVSDAPSAPDRADLEPWARIIRESSEAVGAAAVILVLERYAGDRLSEADRAWARFTAAGCGEAGVRLRAVVLSHRRGVALVDPAEYA
jgi:hypothetical protein